MEVVWLSFDPWIVVFLLYFHKNYHFTMEVRWSNRPFHFSLYERAVVIWRASCILHALIGLVIYMYSEIHSEKIKPREPFIGAEMATAAKNELKSAKCPRFSRADALFVRNDLYIIRSAFNQAFQCFLPHQKRLSWRKDIAKIVEHGLWIFDVFGDPREKINVPLLTS